MTTNPKHAAAATFVLVKGDEIHVTLELLRAIRADMAEMRTEQREQRGRLGAIERSQAHTELTLAELRADMGGRFDRILDRLDRIERRLGLLTAADNILLYDHI